MRCRVCGFVADPDAEKCPNCGAKLPVAEKKAAAADSEMSWNTRDFPKPKEMTDIKMSWPDIRSHTVSISEEEIKEALDKKEPVAVMSEDATEGYFSRPVKEETKEKPASEAEKELPAEDPKTPEEPKRIEIKTAPELEPENKDQLPPFWYTQKFTATGVMQTGPAWPVAPGNSKPGYPASATIETMTLSEPVPIMPHIAAAAAEAAAKKQSEETAPASFTLEDILEECREEDAPKAHPEDHFYTFKKKNEEFQKLLDMEYDRFHAMHGEDKDLLAGATGRPFNPEETVQAKELSAFERMLLEGVPKRTEETPAQKFFSSNVEAEEKEVKKEAGKPAEKPAEPAKPVKAEEPADLLHQTHSTADTKDPDPGLFVIPSGDPSKFNIEQIEHTIRELQAQEIEAENNRSERKKRLAAMAAAREAYFASLDAMEEKKHWFSREPKREVKPAAVEKHEEPAPAPVKAEEPAPAPVKIAEEPVVDTSILDASPIADIFDDPDAEPTKEIPVGNILKALAAGGTVAAASVAAAGSASPAPSRMKTAAMSAASPSITEDIFKTKVFTRPLAEEAEDLAKRYEQPAEEKVDSLQDLIRKYETLADQVHAEAAAEPAAEVIEEPAAEVIEEPAAQTAEVTESEAPAEEAAAEPVEEAAAAPAAEPAAETAAPAVASAAASIAAALASLEKPKAEEPADLPSLKELVEQARAAGEAKAEPKEEPAEVTEAFIQESAPTVPAESTHPFDAAAIEKAAAEALSRPLGSEEPKGADEDDEDDDDDAPGSRHIILKIIAIVLIVCALFEGAVLGLKKFAPEAPVTQSAVQIEEAIGEAVMSFFDTVSEGISRIFNRGGN